MNKRIKSFVYAFNGIKSAIKSETNVKIHITILTLVVIAGFVLHISYFEWLICLVCFGLVLSAELMNTAIEKLVDMISPERRPEAGFIKDVAAGAVLLAAIFSAIAGLYIFVPKLWIVLNAFTQLLK